MRHFVTYILVLLFSGIFTSAFSQQQLDSLLALQHAVDPQEKMFLHFDKNYYSPGDTIWFKAYLFQGLNRSKDSRNFYAELRDDKGNVIDEKTAPVIMSGAFSDFHVPDSFARPTVIFRAFTANMLNGDTSFLYVKTIKIVQPPKKAAPGAKAVVAPPEMRLLPEGGDLVAGLSCNVAFICTGPNETPVYCRGYVKDGSGGQVVNFETLHNGMGKFQMMPEAGKTYTAVWKDEKGKEYSTPMPAVKTQGIVLQVYDADGAKTYTLERPANAPAELQKLRVIATQNQQLIYEATINLSAKTAVRTQIPTADLPSGIVQVTVFDMNQKPVAERICFVNNSNYEFDADAWLTEANPTKRALNRGEVKIADSIAANLSLSVTDADLDVPENEHDNIVSRMLLTGDLRGKIYTPYYYFFSTSDSAGYHLDLVMLTHGWRRYNWANVFAGKKPVQKYIESDYLSLSGKVIGATGSFEQGLALNGFMKTKDSANNFISLPIDRRGMISYPGMIFYDTAKLYLQFSDKNRLFEPSMLSITNGIMGMGQFPPLPAAAQHMAAYEPDSATINSFTKNNLAWQKVNAKRFRDARMLQNVTVTARAKTPQDQLEKEYVGGMFKGDGKGFDVMNDISAASALSIFQYLQGRVAGLQITMNGNIPSLSWRGGTPALYVNEMQTDVEQVSSLNMSDIAYVKVLEPGTAGVVANSGSGVISIYTRKGGDVVNNTEDSKVGVVKLQGYSAVKQFYLPNYATLENNDSFYEDLRTTLYWNPLILLDKTKKRFKFQFYNNDISTHLRLTLEGINDEGKLIHVEKIISKN